MAAIGEACADLGSTRSSGALGWLRADLKFTIDEWDVLNALLADRLAPNADLRLIPFPAPRRSHGESAQLDGCGGLGATAPGTT
ncbi:hypothetical protein [Thiocapsa sp.]|uniref:hypothetical protein n=1 Tax=Thiocapsa sp. TaxID=2024551 RepID=UPI0025EE6BB2|nr:hypothetical protein [Thiocapsa sp.]